MGTGEQIIEENSPLVLKEENHTIILRFYGKDLQSTIFGIPRLSREMNSEWFNLSLQYIV